MTISNVNALQLFQVFRQGATILTAVLLAKSRLDPQQIGVYEILLYIGYTISFFWTTGLIQGFLSHFPKQPPNQQAAFFFNAYITFLVISAFLTGICLAFEPAVLTFFTRQESLPYFSLFVIYLFFNLPTLLLEYFFLLKNWPKLILFFGMLTFGVQVMVIVGPIFLGFGFKYSFIGLIVLAGLKHMILLGFLLLNAQLKISFPLVREWLLLSFPLLLYAFMGGATQAFDNWLVNFKYPGDEEIFAIFRYGARELPLAITLTSTFSNALIPVVAENLTKGMRTIKQRSIKLMHLLFPVSIMLMLTSRWLFPVVFNPVFAASAVIFNVLILITISRLIFTHTILIGIGKSQVMVYVSLIELAINVIASLWLVEYYGLWGIAMGSVIAFTMEKVLQVCYLWWTQGIAIQQYLHLKWFVFYSGLLLLSFAVSL